MSYIVLTTELNSIVEQLTDEEAGIVFKALMRYAVGENPRLPESPIVRATYLILKCYVDRWQIYDQNLGAFARAEL